jgi:hypothetical protein
MREELLKEHSKKMALLVSRYVGNDPERFALLVDLCFDEDVRVVQRAMWVVSHCTDNFPELIIPHLGRFLEYAGNEPPHVAVKRNVLRIMKSGPIPEELEGAVYDLCWKLAYSTKEDVAVRAFALFVMCRVAEKYPELREEVISIAEGFAESESKGLLSCGRNVVKQLQKLHDKN